MKRASLLVAVACVALLLMAFVAAIASDETSIQAQRGLPHSLPTALPKPAAEPERAPPPERVEQPTAVEEQSEDDGGADDDAHEEPEKRASGGSVTPASSSEAPSGERAGGQFLGKLVRPTGRINASSNKPCLFWVNGYRRGVSRGMSVEVSPGQHTVTCRLATGPFRTRHVRVEVGDVASLGFRFR